MNKLNIFAGLILIISLLGAFPASGQSPPAGHSVPSDLDTKIHPFNENLIYGGNYYRAELLRSRGDSWVITLYRQQKTREIIMPAKALQLPEELLEPGTPIVLKSSPDYRGEYIFEGFNRTYRYLYLAGFCLLICSLIGGWITFRSLVGLGAGILYFLFWLVPQITAGSPVLFEIALFYLLISLLVLPNSLGFNRKAISAIFTTFVTGVIALGGLYLLTFWLDVSGLHNQIKLVLEYATRYHPDRIADLNFTMLIAGSALIGILGVVLDVAVDVTSSAAEIATGRPDLPFAALIERVLTVSRRLIGTMCNTLLLAYLGSDLLLLFTLYLLPTPLRMQINRDLFAVEMIRGLGGALGFLIAVPLAVIFYVFFFKPEQKKSDKPPAPPKSAHK